jgi:formylglycine-generating enzyme required for sulfatase activity
MNRLCVLALAALLAAHATPSALTDQRGVMPEEDRALSIAIDDEHSIDLVRIERGGLVMGHQDHDDVGLDWVLNRLLPESAFDEGPLRKTVISHDYYIGRTKITNRTYCAFLNEQRTIGRATEELYVFNRWSGIRLDEDGAFVPVDGCDDLPVNTVPWRGAGSFCRWLSERSSQAMRLPTEAEWAYAARGRTNRYHPWGDEAELDKRYSLWVSDGRGGEGRLLPVLSRPDNATPEGVCDMVGPVGEWCSDFYAGRFDALDRVDPTGPSDGTYRVQRGTSSRASARQFGLPGPDGVDAGQYGFRVLIQAEPDTISGFLQERSSGSEAAVPPVADDSRTGPIAPSEPRGVGRVEGIVFDHEGSLIPRAHLSLESLDPDGYRCYFWADIAGGLGLPEVPVGSYVLTLLEHRSMDRIDSGFTTRIDVTEGEMTWIEFREPQDD